MLALLIGGVLIHPVATVLDAFGIDSEDHSDNALILKPGGDPDPVATAKTAEGEVRALLLRTFALAGLHLTEIAVRPGAEW